jgi:radical SAM superfamily enzyme YgiQ (UPF0313 family)
VKVALINPPLSPEQRYGEFGPLGNRLYNTGLLWLAAVAREKGHDPRIIDAAAWDWDAHRTAAELADWGAEFCGITATTVAIDSAGELAAKIRARMPDAKIVLGGAHVTALPEDTLLDHLAFDAAAIGEGEQTFVEMLDRYATGRDLKGIKGTAYRDSDRIRINPARPLIEDLDRLPFPAWDLLDGLAENYWPTLQCVLRMPSSILITSRGCSASCTFCDRALFGKRERYHGARYVIEMMRTLSLDYGIRDLAIHDENFLADIDRVREICKELIAAKLDLSWSCQGRADIELDDATLDLLKRAGCWQILFGIESADKEVLRRLGKGLDIVQASKLLARVRAAGIRTKGFFMIGAPGETEASLQRTEAYLHNAPLSDIQITIYTPFPGAPLTATLDKFGTVTQGYDKRNLFDVSFVPKGLSEQTLRSFQRRAMARFYLRPSVISDYASRFTRGFPLKTIGRIALGAARLLAWRIGKT